MSNTPNQPTPPPDNDNTSDWLDGAVDAVRETLVGILSKLTSLNREQSFTIVSNLLRLLAMVIVVVAIIVIPVAVFTNLPNIIAAVSTENQIPIVLLIIVFVLLLVLIVSALVVYFFRSQPNRSPAAIAAPPSAGAASKGLGGGRSLSDALKENERLKLERSRRRGRLIVAALAMFTLVVGSASIFIIIRTGQDIRLTPTATAVVTAATGTPTATLAPTGTPTELPPTATLTPTDTPDVPATATPIPPPVIGLAAPGSCSATRFNQLVSGLASEAATLDAINSPEAAHALLSPQYPVIIWWSCPTGQVTLHVELAAPLTPSEIVDVESFALDAPSDAHARAAARGAFQYAAGSYAQAASTLKLLRLQPNDRILLLLGNSYGMALPHGLETLALVNRPDTTRSQARIRQAEQDYEAMRDVLSAVTGETRWAALNNRGYFRWQWAQYVRETTLETEVLQAAQQDFNEVIASSAAESVKLRSQLNLGGLIYTFANRDLFKDAALDPNDACAKVLSVTPALLDQEPYPVRAMAQVCLAYSAHQRLTQLRLGANSLATFCAKELDQALQKPDGLTRWLSEAEDELRQATVATATPAPAHLTLLTAQPSYLRGALDAMTVGCTEGSAQTNARRDRDANYRSYLGALERLPEAFPFTFTEADRIYAACDTLNFEAPLAICQRLLASAS
jgi:hypothetical protein